MPLNLKEFSANTKQMSLETIAASVRNLRNRVVLNTNFWREQEYIPDPRHMLCVETTSLCNLKCKFCAYSKKQSARMSMSNEDFSGYINQATAMGFSRFQLTPCTGDVFMDKHFLAKLEFLETHEQVDGYEFFTNFTLPKAETIERLATLAKLTSLNISIYGHNPDSFVAITKSTEKVYSKLVENLSTLFKIHEKFGEKLSFGFRSYRHVPSADSSDLLKMLEQFRNSGVTVRTSRIYNNWGGYITNEDVRGLDMQITESNSTYKKGACSLLFNQVQVTASGIVNACACRDVDHTLKIGDLNDTTLAEILSPLNESYMQIINEQQEGRFRKICQNCDFYKSIYRRRSGHGPSDPPLLKMPQFHERIAKVSPE